MDEETMTDDLGDDLIVEEADEPMESPSDEDAEDEKAASDEGEEEELIEIEFDEDDVYAYIVDEDDNEIGFIILNEDGEEEEYYYADEEEEEQGAAKAKKATAQDDDDEYDLGITREGVAETTADLNAIYKDGVEIAAELKSTFDDISEGLSFLKKK